MDLPHIAQMSKFEDEDTIENKTIDVERPPQT